MKINMSINKKLFLSHFLAIILVSGSIGTYFYLKAEESLINNLQDRLKYSAALISQAIDAKELELIQTKSDVNRIEYQKNLELLRIFRKTNPDISYLYIMRMVEGKIYFVIDSDETSAQAFPGQEYPHKLPTLIAGFSRPSVDDKIYTDQWGSFMSGYSPLKNGDGRYLVGMDMRATEVENKLYKLRVSGIISLIFSIIFALIFSKILSSHFYTPINLLISKCSSIAKGDVGEIINIKTGDELEKLITAFNEMSVNLKKTYEDQRKAEEELRNSKELLETKVEERTKELVELTKKLVNEISERKQVEERLARTATTDILTGIMNRRAMLEQLRYHSIRYHRNKIPFVILLIDIDYFKRINDTYGHDVGDEVLISIADLLIKSTRSQDLISRWGGEEFLILLPETKLKGGIIAGEKIRTRIGNERIKVKELEISVTVSIGVSEFKDGQTIELCIKNADQALYEAKNSGRNKVIAYGEV